MKLQYTTPDGNMTVEFEGDTQTDIVAQLSAFQDTFVDRPTAKFKGEFVNGLDNGAYIKYIVRNVDDNLYYEKRIIGGPMHGFKKALGVHKKGGGLFPKYDIPENCIPAHNGWHLWQKPEQSTTEEKSSKNDSNGEVPF